jgi:hypothetical protein
LNKIILRAVVFLTTEVTEGHRGSLP